MNKAKQLNIRIKFTPQAPKVVTEESAYIYHWHRIIGVSLFVTTTITALIYGVFSYLNQPAPATQNATVAVQATQPSSVKEFPPQTQPGRKVITSASNSNKPIPITVKPEVTPEKPLQTNPASLFTQAEVELFSEQVKRFVIAETVKDREPVGNINNIRFDANNVATVYAYSHAVGLKGETLYYKWYLDGKEIAQIKTRVAANRWRSYSRKFIQPHMQGRWSVVLENGKGETLAVSRFQY